MDDLHLLRTLRDDTPDPGADALTRARVLLTERIITEETTMSTTTAAASPARRKRRLGLRATGLSFAAAAVAGGVLLSGVLPGGGASAEASEVLAEAARNTIHAVDPVVPAGSYLEIRTHAEVASTLGADGEFHQWLDEQDSELYIPSDRSGEWVLHDGLRTPVEYFSPGAERIAQEQHAKAAAQHADGETYRGANGDFGELGPIDTRAAVASLPTDPEALLAHFRAAAEQTDAPGDAETFTLIVDTLRSGLATAEVRSGLYQALAEIPGVDVRHHAVTLDGETGVAIGRDDGERRDEVVVDPETGQFIGERSVLLQDREAMPAGTVVESSSVTTRVVRTAP